MKNNEQLIKTYENRQVDLIVLTDGIKEKVATQDDLRSKISKLNKEIEEKENKLEKQREEAEALEKKLKSQRTENETIKVSIEKNKIEYQHTNNLIEAKEDELKVLNEQIEKKEARLKSLDELTKEFNEGFPEMEKQKETYLELLEKYKVQLTEKQQKMIGIESRIQELNDNLATYDEQIKKKQDLIDVSEKRLNDIKNAIEESTTEYNEREERLLALTEKIEDAQPEYDKLIKTKEVIEESISDSRAIFQKLKAELEKTESEIRDKESRINRLEFLSFIYRASKFFGGILILAGIFFVILAIMFIFNLLQLGQGSNTTLFVLLMIASVLTLISGFFHLEKS
ncbi:MAG: hypothetical protein EU539_12055 [Promethearchaeota archaeon]|nr:MAG: hypothetical protein EU539_12055 [Candidatus Lokiarchaeota archaeon]